MFKFSPSLGFSDISEKNYIIIKLELKLVKRKLNLTIIYVENIVLI